MNDALNETISAVYLLSEFTESDICIQQRIYFWGEADKETHKKKDRW